MNELLFMFHLMLFIGTTILFSQYFYVRTIKADATKIAKSLHFDIVDLPYTFDQLIYFIALPPYLPGVELVQLNDLYVKRHFSSTFFPRLNGLIIYLNTDGEEKMIAHLVVKKFRIPYLDRLKLHGHLDEDKYAKIIATKLMHPTTEQELLEEVLKQLRVGRYDLESTQSFEFQLDEYSM